jgi:hypothetical protein
MSLRDAIAAVTKIEARYRTAAVDRGEAVKLIGYSGLSGPANKALAALTQYGLTERAGKGDMRVTRRAVDILHGDDAERMQGISAAASEPDLFGRISARFPGITPPESGVLSFLKREGFNPTAVRPAARAFLDSMAYVEEARGRKSHSDPADMHAESDLPAVETAVGGAAVGDFIQWENSGVHQFEAPRRVRWVSEDGAWVAVEGYDGGIPMEQVTVEPAFLGASSPVVPPELPSAVQATRGQRKAVFPISEGDVTFVFPADLTSEGLEELEAYLAVFLKKERRRVTGG